MTVRCLTWPEQEDVLSKSDSIGALVANRASLTCLAVGRRWAVAGSLDGTVKLIPTADPGAAWRVLSTGEGDTVHSVAVSPDEALVLAGMRSGKVVPFATAGGGEPVGTPLRHYDRVEAIAFAPDGTLCATGGRDNTVRLWQRSGSAFRPFVTHATAGPVVQLAFGPGGARMAFVAEGQRAFNVWDVAHFREQLKAHKLDP